MENIMCPVCTLYLRPGITLKQHLTSHPKQKVIEALVRLAEGNDEPEKTLPLQNDSRNAASTSTSVPQNTPTSSQHPPQFSPLPLGMGTAQNMGNFPGNHFFIYQQSMSTTSPHQANVLNINQPYLVPAPAFLNAQQMMPYIYQQQQVFMASNAMHPHLSRALPPFELPSCSGQAQVNNSYETIQINQVPEDSEDVKPAVKNARTPEGEAKDVTCPEQEATCQEEVQSVADSVSVKSVPVEQEKDPCGSPAESVVLMEQSDEEEVAHGPEDEECQSDNKQQIVEIQEADIGQEEEAEYKGGEDDSKVQSLVCEDSVDGSFHEESDYEHAILEDVSDHVDQDHEYVEIAPLSPNQSDWGLNEDINQELDKACQTQQAVHHLSSRVPGHSIHEDVQEEDNVELSEPPADEPDYFYVSEDHQSSSEHAVIVSTHEDTGVIRTIAHHTYEQAEPIYTSTNILHGGEPVDFVTMEDLDGMQVIIGDFHTTPAISQVEDFEHMDSDRPRVLMTIGEMTHGKSQQFCPPDPEDNSVPNLNMQSDERMPARGELSGQESLGSASNISWHHATYQQQDVTTVDDSYNHVWDDSNGAQVNHLGLDGESDNHTDHIIDMKFQPAGTEVVMDVPEEFKKVDADVQDEEGATPDVKPKLVGLDIDKKKTKKLIIKPKKPKKQTSSFNDVFTKFKVERCETEVTVGRVAIPGTELNPADREMLLDVKPGGSMPKITCQMCNETFRTKKLLRQHAIEVHNFTDTKLSCAICRENFLNEYKFTEHLKIHPLECKMCGKLFYRRQNLSLHMKRHLGIKPFQCDVCDKTFITKQKMDEHRNIHSGHSPFKCHMCEDSFKRYSNLVQHRNRHHFQIKKKLKDYVCYCGEVFHSKKKLAWHQETHDQKPKSCAHCSEKFIHQASLSRHMRHAHNVEHNTQKAIAICPICKGTYLKTSIDAHIKNHSGQKPFACLICNKEFTTKWNLKLHKWTHTSRTQKPFKCEMCKSAFIRNTDYIAHMNSHKNVRPYTCNYCGAQFIRKYNCQRHVKEHENDKTYNCNVCGKSFHRSYYLKDHMRVHSGIRPFSCHICGKTSTTKSNHNKHVQIHHAREPVSTEN